MVKKKVFMHKLVDFPDNDYITFSVWVEYNEEDNTVLTHTVQLCHVNGKTISLVDGWFDPRYYNGYLGMAKLQDAGLSLDAEYSEENSEVALQNYVRQYRVAIREALRYAESFRNFQQAKMNVMERNYPGGVA